MKIKGIGTIAKNKAMEILTAEGRKAVRSGDTCTDSFNNSYKWVPDELKEDLTPDQLGRLTESFYECYGAGKNDV